MLMAAGIFIGLVFGIARAFVLRDLWSWFVVPLGMVEISVVHAFGLSLLVGLFSDYKPTADRVQAEVEKQDGPFPSPLVGELFGRGFGLLIVWAFGALASGMI